MSGLKVHFTSSVRLTCIHHFEHKLTVKHVKCFTLVTAWHYHMLPVQAQIISTALHPAAILADTIPYHPLYTTETVHHPPPPFT